MVKQSYQTPVLQTFVLMVNRECLTASTDTTNNPNVTLGWGGYEDEF